jgi:hypothetical protein
MHEQSRRQDYLLFAGSLLLVHGLGLLVLLLLVAPHLIPEPSPWWFFLPPLAVPLVFGFRIRSWQQFVLYAFTTIIVWQLYIYLSNRIYYHDINDVDPAYIIGTRQPRVVQFLHESVVVLVPLGVGILVGMVKRKIVVWGARAA